MNTTPTKPKQPATASSPVSYLTPVANIRETQEGYVLEAEMPGVGRDGLEITVDRGELTLVGHRTPRMPAGEALYRESRGSDYRRLFELDPSIDTAKIAAKLEQGVLTLQLPKTAAVKPRKIAVN